MVALSRSAQTPWGFGVLFVDDDPAHRVQITGALHRNPRACNVSTANTPQAAMTSVVTGAPRPDAILIDIAASRANGFRFVPSIREGPWKERLPIALPTYLDSVHEPGLLDEICLSINDLIDQLGVGA